MDTISVIKVIETSFRIKGYPNYAFGSDKNVVNNKNCNCGTIANDGIDTNPDGSSCYWLEIRSECSGNKKKFCFDQDVWMNNYVGSNFCVTNQPGW